VKHPNRLVASIGAVVALAAATPVVALAKNGADDPAGHVRKARGADDNAGHLRHGHGADDGPNHR
jgi:hypothetical protein